MKNKQIFKKYYSRLAKEGMLKALIWGFIFGLIASTVPALIAYFFNYNGIWIALGVLTFVAVIVTILFYNIFFRPTTKQIAKRVDKLGLEERLITMLELEKDESFMAMCQREDAKQALSAIHQRQLRFAIFKVFKVPIIILALAFTLSAVMGTMTILGVEGQRLWRDGGDGRVPEVSAFEVHSISYIPDGGGFIYGEIHQLVLHRQNSTTVVAIADPGWFFYEWSDGRQMPERRDLNVQRSFVVFAIFMEDGDGSPEPGDEDEDPQPEEFFNFNLVHDAETYFRDVLGQYWEIAMQALAEDREIPDRIRIIIESYFRMIR